MPVSLADMDPGTDMTLAAAKIMHLVFATVWYAGSQRVLLPKKTAKRFIASSASAVSSKDAKAAVQRLERKKVIVSACGVLGGRNKPRPIPLFESVRDHNRFDYEFVVSDEIWSIFQSPKMYTYIGLDTIRRFKSVNGIYLYTALTGLFEVQKRRKNLHSYSILKHRRGVDLKTGKSLYPKTRKQYVANILDVPFGDLATWTGMRSTAGGTEPRRIERKVGDICTGYLKSHGHFMEDPDVFGIYPASVDEAGIKFEYYEAVRPIEYQRMSPEAKKWYILKTNNEDLRQTPTAFQLVLRLAGIEDGYRNARRVHDEWKHYIWTARDTYPGDKPGAEHFRDFADLLAERRSLEHLPAKEMKLAEAHWAWLEGKAPRPEEGIDETPPVPVEDPDEDVVVPEFPELPEVQEPDEMEAFNIEFMGLRRSPFEHNRVLRDVDGERQYLHDGALDAIRVRLEVIPFLTSKEVGAIKAQRRM
ncbi:RepB family plasmid replication initiator protein [Ruegeria sp. HKCCA5929]|uniref:RepB family plasmid replication initiator protein n=1 Tax=Ruegeria sp. HKCCA5929 TaxID=2682988 RepID=UPI001488BECF|nr:RepB family plasmid replication initiator protein [Ruegeria sp. HKCCA5929]